MYFAAGSPAISSSMRRSLYMPSVPNPSIMNHQRIFEKSTMGRCAYTCIEGLPENACRGFFFKESEVNNCIHLYEEEVNLWEKN